MIRFDVVGFSEGAGLDCLLRLKDLSIAFKGKGFRGFRPDIELPVKSREFSEWTIQGGGLVPTAMAAVGRLGGKATIRTRVGDDEWGRRVIFNFKEYNVDTSHILLDKNIRGRATFILIGANGSNQWVAPETLKDFDLPSDIRRVADWVMANPRTPEEMKRRDAYSREELEVVKEGKVLNLGSASNASLEAARIAKRSGVLTCFDMERSEHPNFLEHLRNITYCISSRRGATDFTKETDPVEMCKRLLSYGPEVVGVTLGEEGSVFATKDEVIKRKAFKIQAVDTTGAGDVFHGAFSFGIVQGWDLARVIEFSSAVSAIKCTKLGGRAGLPTLPEVEAFLKKRVEEIR